MGIEHRRDPAATWFEVYIYLLRLWIACHLDQVVAEINRHHDGHVQVAGPGRWFGEVHLDDRPRRVRYGPTAEAAHGLLGRALSERT